MSTASKLQPHPLAAIFPDASSDDYQALRDSINHHGQGEPIVLLGNEILDGRTRYRVCLELKIPPQLRQYNPAKDGQDPITFVMDRNLHRRHLTVGQKATVALEIKKAIKAAQEAATAQPATPATPNGPEDASTTQPGAPAGASALEQAAKQAGVSTRSVQDAEYLERNDPERLESVKKGETSLNAATTAAKAEAEKAKTEPSLLNQNTPPIINPYRAECADLMAASHGDKFAEAVRNDTILRDKELREFMKLAIQDQQQITALVARGWKVREAVKFAKGIFEKDDPIRDLLNLAIMRKGKAVAKLDGHTILVVADQELADMKGEFVLVAINGILEAQRKPESTRPSINSVNQALNAAESKEAKPKPTPRAPLGDLTPEEKATFNPKQAATTEPIKGLKPKAKKTK